MKPSTLYPSIFILACLLLQTTCSLDKVDAIDPVACFTVSGDGCTGPCDITFANCSENAATYAWEFGDGGTSSAQAPSHAYANAGTYTVKLTVTGDDGTSTDQTTATVTVNSKTFIKTLNVSTLNTSALHGIEAADHRFHILCKDANNAFASVYANADGDISGAMVTYAVQTNINYDNLPDGTGGFLMLGEAWNGTVTNAYCARVGSTQTLAFNKLFQYGDATVFSAAGGGCVTSVGDFAICGSFVKTDIINSGFARLNSSGTYVTAPVQSSTQPSSVEGFHTNSLAQRPNGTYIATANIPCFFPPCPYEAWIMFFNSNGIRTNKSQLTQFNEIRKITRLEGDTYAALCWVESSNLSSIVKLDGTGVVSWVSTLEAGAVPADLIKCTDGSVAVCGNKAGKPWLQKFSASNGANIFNIEYPSTGGVVSLFETSDLGFFMTGSISANSETDLLLIKTDKDGNAE